MSDNFSRRRQGRAEEHTHIHIYVLQSPEKQKEAAQNAALLAFQQSRHQAAIKKKEGQTGEKLTPPKTRKQKREDTKVTSPKEAQKLAQTKTSA